MDGIKEGVAWRHQARCPYLPVVEMRLTADWTRAYRGKRDGNFYLASLEYGQSLWMDAKPAQAILQLNKAWSAELVGDEDVIKRWPLPYRALLWILRHVPKGSFVGNPVRHFQHLATRVGGENAKIRSWRGWACYHLSVAVLPADDFPSDHLQMVREQLVLPTRGEIFEAIGKWGIVGERDLLEEILGEIEGQ